MPQVVLNIDLQARQLVRGFSNPISSSFPACFQGDTLQLVLRFLNPTGTAAVPYTDSDQSSSYIQAAIGTIGGVPSAGTFTLTDPDATQTTSPIPYNADGPALQTALRAGLATNWAAATVVGDAEGPWIITNGVNGARSALLLVGTALIPPSQGDVIVQEAGDGSTLAVQYLKLQLSPIAYQDAWTPLPPAAIVVANVQTGGVSGSNSIQSVTLANSPYAGTFTLSFGGQTTPPIAYNASPSLVQSAFAGLSSVGSGNITVGGVAGAYTLSFVGSLGGAARAAITADASGLVSPVGVSADFSLATAGIEEAIGEDPALDQVFELRITPSGGAPATILQTGITIANDLIPNSPAIPTPTARYYTAPQVDSIISALDLGTASTLAFDTDPTLAADSDARVATQKAVKTYLAALGLWQIMDADFTAAAAALYQVDTTAGAVNVTPPPNPSIGDSFQLGDATAHWATAHAVFKYDGASKVNGTTVDFPLDVNGGKVSAVYISAGYGWSVK